MEECHHISWSRPPVSPAGGRTGRGEGGRGELKDRGRGWRKGRKEDKVARKRIRRGEVKRGVKEERSREGKRR